MTKPITKAATKATTKTTNTYATKVCPQCGSRCFADMDTCYGCLHHFGDGVVVSETLPKKKSKKKNKTQKLPFEAQEIIFAELIEELQRRGFSEAKIPVTLQLRKSDEHTSALSFEIQVDR